MYYESDFMYFISFINRCIFNILKVMKIDFDISVLHHVVAASTRTYLEPTKELKIDRTLAHHVLIYIAEGEWTFIEIVDGKEIEHTLKANDLLIFAAGRQVYIRKPCKLGTKAFCIHITKEGHDLDCNYANALSIESKFSCQKNSSIIHYFEETCNSFWSDKNFSQIRADAFLTLLLSELDNVNKEIVLSREVNSVLNILEKYITQECNSNSLQEEITNSTKMSYKKTSMQFKKETGKTIHAYLISKKLEFVAEELENQPDEKLKEIAAKYKFYDEFYLSKIFKRKYGVSPVEYRKKQKNKRNRYDTMC